MRYLLLLLILSCGSSNVIITANGPIYVEERLQPFYQRFMEYAEELGVKVNCDNLSMYTTDEIPSGTQLAVAKVYSNGYKEIIIYNRFYETATDVAKEIVVFHEIFHACLRKEHRNNSIMQSNMLNESLYLYYYSFYIKEAFLGVVDYTEHFIYRDY